MVDVPMPEDLLKLDEAYPGMAIFDQLRAYAAQVEAATIERCAKLCDEAVPHGWKLVPVESTEVMQRAHSENLDGLDPHTAQHDWAAMLAAAPPLDGRPSAPGAHVVAAVPQAARAAEPEQEIKPLSSGRYFINVHEGTELPEYFIELMSSADNFTVYEVVPRLELEVLRGRRQDAGGDAQQPSESTLASKAEGVAAFLESTVRINSRDIGDWRDDATIAAKTLRSAVDAARALGDGGA